MNRMSDLISRKALIENLNKFAPEHYSALVNDLIMKQEAAFDKEKVIEELEDYLFEKYCVEGDEKIAEIVEKGGIR